METAVFVGASCSFGIETIEEIAKNYKKMFLLESQLYFDDLLTSIDELQKAYPDIIFIPKKIDITDISQFTTILFEIESQGDEVTSFIYAAGVNILAPVLNVTEEIWDKINNVNLKGFFFAAKDVISHMLVHKLEGNVVAIASQHGVVANFDRAPYCASKAGLIHLVKELALEFAEHGISINVVSPSFILSEKNNNILLSPKAKRECLYKIPQKKYVTSKNVAKAISFLIDKDTKGITGHNLLVDGGWTIQ